MKKYNLVIVGATGLVGEMLCKILQERNFPVGNLRLLGTQKSVGKKLWFYDSTIEIEILTSASFSGTDIAIFSASAEISTQFIKEAVQSGATVIDKSSAYRLHPEVPLVVPEVNANELIHHRGIIASPNCTTIPLVMVLKPLHELGILKRIVISTYQSVSGAGKNAVELLKSQSMAILSNKKVEEHYQLAFNLIPQIDEFQSNRYCLEEQKLINETRKILNLPNLKITATTVRVPTFIGHAISVNVETEKKITTQQATSLLAVSEGIKVIDTDGAPYPLSIDTEKYDEVLVGRIREDDSIPCGLNLWVVVNNLRKGAALNTVQIAELLTRMQ